MAKTGGLAGFTQMLIGIQLFFYVINYPKISTSQAKSCLFDVFVSFSSIFIF
jgi:hypothetical protein